MMLLSRVFYDLGIFSYYGGIKIAALFNKKAEKWLEGRKNLFPELEKNIPEKGVDLWVHCASLGEFEQGRPLIEALRKSDPNLFILLTFFSPSGYEIRKSYKEADFVSYLPLDTSGNAKEFLRIIRPRLTVFVKYEFWYHFIKELKIRGVPLVLISGIFRENQLFFRKYGGLYKEMLRYFRHLFVQDETSAALLKEIGLTAVSCTGDTRFDRVIAISENIRSFPEIVRFLGGEPCWVAGSTWPEDEKMIAAVAEEVPRWILAPHEIHEAHLQEIERIFQGKTIRYSVLKEQGMEKSHPKILIIDSIGLLSALYKLGEVAYVGGGFGKGIHNVLEAAVYHIPVVFGPHHSKFREAHLLLEKGGAFTFKSEAELKNIVRKMKDKRLLMKSGNAAGELIWENRGATEKIFRFIQEKRFLTRS